MSFRLSAGTLDSMAGVFAPSRKRPAGSGSGSDGKRDGGGAILGFAVASMFPKPAAGATGNAPLITTKQAFGGGGHAAASGRAISTMDRTARRAPEVMVRITGRQHGGGHVLANFAYISRLGHGADRELGLYTSDGEVIRDGRAMQDLAQDWHEWEMGGDARRKGATSLSMILSMPPGTDSDRLRAAALDFAGEEFANRSWVASLHVDRDHPHVHLTFARRDLDGRRLHPNRDDLFRYRQRFAQKLRDRGIEANATPAKARGIDAKHEHIAAAKVRAKGGQPRIDQTRAARALLLDKEGRADPVSSHLRQRQAVVRGAYERSIAELRASPSIVNQTVANSLQRFIDGMGEPEPNSIRVLRSMHRSRADDDRAAPIARAEKGEEGETLTDALARSRAMRERIEARRAQNASVPLAAGELPTQERSSDEPGVQPRSADQTGVPVQETVAMDDLVREVLGRNQAQRDRDRKRDRNSDKGGPAR